MRVKENIGDTYGWMGVDTADYDDVTLAGYSDDFKSGQTAGVHVGCKIKKRLPSFWLHDCDNTRGASGGPMFIIKDKVPYIVAINVAEYRDGGEKSLYLTEYEEKHANIAVPASVFLAELKKIRGDK